MRSTIVRVFAWATILTTAFGTVPGFAQDSGKTASVKTAAAAGAKSSVKTASAKTESVKKTDSEDKTAGGDDSFIIRTEKKIDAAAGKCVGAIASVFFYELGKKSSEETLSAATEVTAFKTARSELLKTLPTPAAKDQKAELTREHIKKLSDELAFPAFKKFLDASTDQGFNVRESDLTVTLRNGEITVDEAADLQRVLNAKFTAGRTAGFSVKRIDEDGTSLKPGEAKIGIVQHGFPIVVLWLVLGAVFFTLRMRFINFRGFKHAIKVTAGKYDNPNDKGEVNHFQALTAALSATVGLGNIAGVAIAVMAGGPGATFWMVVAGLLGMSSKFTECTLGQKYREVRSDGRIMGGAMYYLSKGLADLKLAPLGKALGVLFAVLCVFASLGGGNAFQVNQSLRAVEQTIPAFKEMHWLYGVIMAALVGVVIIGGIRRIASTAEKIVPLMCGVYVLACLWILAMNFAAIPTAIGIIMNDAFTPKAGYGGFLGVLIMGFKRAAFSNEAGVGSAAIAHAAAKTEYPVREGIVALLEPFIDTVIVCTMTALVIVITGAYENPDYAKYVSANNGAALTSEALGEQISWFPYVLSVAVILFAYSTMISWSYYGERCWAYLFGDRASMAYRVLFLVFVVLGSVMSASNVLDLSDLMILGMAFPNILGVLLLSGMVKRDLDSYWKKLKAGELERPES